MDLFDAIEERYSCRDYEQRPVETEKLEKILKAAQLAPSARNSQNWRFVVVTKASTRQKLQTAAADQAFVGQAPVVIAACSNNNRRMNLCSQPYSSINVAIALEHIALAATALGLGTCWIGAFKPQQVRRILNIPTSIEIVELMTLGYPADKGASPKRLAVDEIVCREEWSFLS